MTRYIFLFLLIISVTSPVWANGPASLSKGKLVVVADIWCPYNCIPGSDSPGYLIELMVEAFHSMGIEIEYRLLPWQRALTAVETGIADAALGTVRGDHGNTLIGKEHLGYDETIFVTRRDSRFVYISPSSLDDKHLAIISDYSYADNGPLDIYLQSRVKAKQRINVITGEAPLESMFRMLERKRIDAFPESRFVVQYSLKESRLKNQISLVKTNIKNQVYVGFSPNKKGKTYLALFDKQIAIMKKDGRLSSIMKKYGVSPD